MSKSRTEEKSKALKQELTSLGNDFVEKINKLRAEMNFPLDGSSVSPSGSSSGDSSIAKLRNHVLERQFELTLQEAKDKILLRNIKMDRVDQGLKVNSSAVKKRKINIHSFFPEMPTPENESEESVASKKDEKKRKSD